MYKYIIHIISTVDSRLMREIEINASYLLVDKMHYEFRNDDNDIIACFPIDRTIVLRVKKII